MPPEYQPLRDKLAASETSLRESQELFHCISPAPVFAKVPVPVKLVLVPFLRVPLATFSSRVAPDAMLIFPESVWLEMTNVPAFTEVLPVYVLSAESVSWPPSTLT